MTASIRLALDDSCSLMFLFSPDDRRLNDLSHALNAKSGAKVWTRPERFAKTRYSRTYFAQPLSDRYLESQGKQGVSRMDACTYNVFVNGVWYGHSEAKSALIVGKEEDSQRGEDRFTVNKTVWEYMFNSKACSTPSPAYGRLYYAPNGEGVVYCFEMANQGNGTDSAVNGS